MVKNWRAIIHWARALIRATSKHLHVAATVEALRGVLGWSALGVELLGGVGMSLVLHMVKRHHILIVVSLTGLLLNLVIILAMLVPRFWSRTWHACITDGKGLVIVSSHCLLRGDLEGVLARNLVVLLFSKLSFSHQMLSRQSLKFFSIT